MRLIAALLAAAACAFAQTPQLAGCAVFSADNIWNVAVDTLPLDASSAAYVQTIGAATVLHPDFGAGGYGIPFSVVAGDQPKVPVRFDYRDESDPGPYPIPANPPIEGGSDRHVLVLDRDHCLLYEMWNARPSGGGWQAGSGAIFDLKSNALRPAGWTSADAAGLPILPGLVRYDEVTAGEIRHAIRLTVPQTRNTYVWPARHQASALGGLVYPPMGQRFRLRRDFDLAGFSPASQVILRALKTYGMMVADNGRAWYITGAPDERWDNDTLVGELGRVKGADFEAVDSSLLMEDADSARVPAVVNAADYRAGPVAPGELVSIFGANLGPADGVTGQVDGDGHLGVMFGGMRAIFDGVAAPLLYVSAGQINAVVPFEVAGRSRTLLDVRRGDATVFAAALNVQAAAPGVFSMDASGSGEGAVLNQDYTRNSPAAPAGRGSYVMIWATGGGETNPPSTDGEMLLGSAFPRTVKQVMVRIGGIASPDVNYAGGAPGFVAGTLQVNAKVPVSVTPGAAVPLVLTIDGIDSQPGVTIAVR
jgi:uncharacterized protein (TIGR03437 family)